MTQLARLIGTTLGDGNAGRRPQRGSRSYWRSKYAILDSRCPSGNTRWQSVNTSRCRRSLRICPPPIAHTRRQAAEVGKQHGAIESQLVDLPQQPADCLGRDRDLAQPDLTYLLPRSDAARQTGLGKVLRLAEYDKAGTLRTQPPVDMRRLDRNGERPSDCLSRKCLLQVGQEEPRLLPFRNVWSAALARSSGAIR